MVSKPRTIKSNIDLLNNDTILRAILLIACVFAVSACSKIPFMDRLYGDFKTKPTQSQPNTKKSKAYSGSVASLSNDQIKGQGNIDKTAKDLQPFKGVQLQELFSYDEKNKIKRIKRVEEAVLDIRTDLDILMPSILRLIAIEGDIKNLITQLETLIHPPPTTTEIGSNTAPNIGKSKQDAKKPPTNISSKSNTAKNKENTYSSNNLKTGISSLRIGHHKDKSRLVIDGDKKYNFQVDIDNGENLLIIDIKGATWSGKRSWSSKKDPLVKSYNVTKLDNDTGERVVIQLKKEVIIYKQMMIPPNKDSHYFRKIIDLK